jgi:hypothetical protein
MQVQFKMRRVHWAGSAGAPHRSSLDLSSMERVSCDSVSRLPVDTSLPVYTLIKRGSYGVRQEKFRSADEETELN